MRKKDLVKLFSINNLDISKCRSLNRVISKKIKPVILSNEFPIYKDVQVDDFINVFIEILAENLLSYRTTEVVVMVKLDKNSYDLLSVNRTTRV